MATTGPSSASKLENDTQSFMFSKKYIANLLKLSVINIIYNRIEIPAEEFEDRCLQGVQFIICKNTSKHPFIITFYECIKGACDALDRNFLEEFYLLLKNKDGVLGEFYKFSFGCDFNDDDEEENRGVDSRVLYRQIKRLFENIRSLGQYKKWDEGNFFLAQIKYNDRAPSSYQPPYYVICPSNSDDEAIERMHHNLQLTKIIDITTGYHTLKCTFAGGYISDETIAVVISDTSTVFCICESSVNHEALTIIHCTSCNQPFHSVCFGILGVDVPDFRCTDCGGSANLPPAITPDCNVKLFIRLRLLTGFCHYTMETPDEIMDGFPNPWERYALWKNLERLRVIFKKNGEWLVNSARVTEGCLMRVFFCEREEMEDLTEEE